MFCLAGNVNFWLWPTRVKIALAGCGLCLLLGIVFLIVGVSEVNGKDVILGLGVTLLSIVIVAIAVGVIWVILVKTRHSYSTNNHVQHVDSPTTSNRLQHIANSRVHLTPSDGRDPSLHSGERQKHSPGVSKAAAHVASDSSTDAVLCNVSRLNPSLTTVSSSDFWQENATLQRLPTANSLQFALENQSGLLQYEDFQQSEEGSTSVQPSRAVSVSNLESQKRPESSRSVSHSQETLDRVRKESARSSSHSSRSSSRHGSTDTLPKSISTSHMHPIPIRTRPRSSSTVARTSVIDSLALEAASQQLIEQEQLVEKGRENSQRDSHGGPASDHERHLSQVISENDSDVFGQNQDR